MSCTMSHIYNNHCISSSFLRMSFTSVFRSYRSYSYVAKLDQQDHSLTIDRYRKCIDNVFRGLSNRFNTPANHTQIGVALSLTLSLYIYPYFYLSPYDSLCLSLSPYIYFYLCYLNYLYIFLFLSLTTFLHAY